MTTPGPKIAKEKKRALPTEFERQVKQIRADIATVKSNLMSAERSLQGVPVLSNVSNPGAVPANSVASTATPIAPAPGVGVKEEPEAASR